MRRTMVGVAPAANPPSAFEMRDVSSGSEHADTAVALPPDMIRALADLTMDGAPPSAPMTKRMSEAPSKATPSAAPSSVFPSSPRSSPSVAPSPPRSSASIAPSPPRSAPSVAPPRSAPSAAAPRSAPSVSTQNTVATDPMAAPLERKPLVTTVALDPIAPPPPIPMIGGSASRASTSPPAYPSAPPPAGTINGMPRADASAPMLFSPSMAPVPHAAPMPMPLPMPASMSVRSDGETMVLAPPHAAAPVAATVSMPPPMPHVSSAAMHAPGASAPNAWSAPVLSSSVLQDDPSAPLTYQVFNPAAVPVARPSSSSRGSYPEERTKAGFGLRVGLALVGLCVLVGTVGAIIIGATDDPPLTGKTPPTATTAAAAPALPAPPAPVVVADPAPAPPSAAPPSAPVPATATAKPASSAKAKPAGSAPPTLKGAKIPPNPFGGGAPLPSKRK